jgi:hypothetical protein
MVTHTPARGSIFSTSVIYDVQLEWVLIRQNSTDRPVPIECKSHLLLSWWQGISNHILLFTTMDNRAPVTGHSWTVNRVLSQAINPRENLTLSDTLFDAKAALPSWWSGYWLPSWDWFPTLPEVDLSQGRRDFGCIFLAVEEAPSAEPLNVGKRDPESCIKGFLDMSHLALLEPDVCLKFQRQL